MVRRIADFKPHILGMPLFTFKFPEASEIARAAKELDPGIRVIVGGAHATALPARALEQCAAFDAAIMGEGEDTVLELMRAFESGASDFENIKGITWRRGAAIVKNPPRPSIKDLDALAFPDWSAFPLDRYFPLYAATRKFLELPVSTARGCKGRCAFCFRLTRGYIRARSPENVIAELQRDVDAFDARSIIFMDEAFTAEPERTHTLCDHIIQAGLHEKIHWLCETRVDKVSAELLHQMKTAGCAHVSFGIESGDQEVLDKNMKGTTLQQARDAIRMTKRTGIQVDAYFIFGLPYDTRASMERTQSFALNADPDFANFFIMVPYPGTLAMKLAKQGKANLKLLTEDWSQYGIQIGGALELNDTPRSELERLQFTSYLKFYLRPRKLKSLLRIVSFKAVPVYLLNLLRGLLKIK
jgi:anaerobic magnesium-protoporphyrin IX monomethyl ester cyclase